MMDNTIALKLRQSIRRHEGFKQFPYTDTTGNITIGYGRNLSTIGISASEADVMLNDDVVNATSELYHFQPWVQTLDDVRKAVLIEMTFNMGIEKLSSFKEFLQLIKDKEYKAAAQDGLSTEWAKQVGNRANDLMYSLEMGVM